MLAEEAEKAEKAGEAGRAAASGGRERDARPAAGLIVAGCRVAYEGAVNRQLEGDPVEVIAVEQEPVLRRTFDVLSRALPGGGC